MYASISPASSSTPSSRATCVWAKRRASAGRSSITIRTAPGQTRTSSLPRRWRRVAEQTRGMGRGLAAILSSTAERDAERDPELRDLPVDLIGPSPHQPRQHFDEPSLLALAGSLRERGVLQPVLVRPLP